MNTSYAVAIMLGLVATTASGQVEKIAARMATYKKSTGEIYFALSLAPKVIAAPVEKADVVILFDTSASQIGLFRDDSLSCLERLLEGLRSTDRVQLFAIDLKALPLNAELVPADHAAIAEAIKKLKKRTPLGSTDVPGGLLAAASALEKGRDGAARSIVYIGDGVSRANFVNVAEMSDVLAQLRKTRTSVSGFAIGPQRNVELLAAWANHSGGNLLLDAEGSDVAIRAGGSLAAAVQRAVLWPTKVTLDKTVLAVYPETFPPLRMDRDSVVIGMLKNRDAEQTITMTVDGPSGEQHLSWKVKPEPESPEFGFLPKLVELAAKDGGVRLPTVGSSGLREIGRVILNDAQTMLKLGAQAIKRSDFKAAARAAKSVLERDPDNPEAHALQRAAERGLRRQAIKAKNGQQEKKEPATN